MSIEILAESRPAIGKSYSKKLKKEKKIPAVLYGREMTNKTLQVVAHDIDKVLLSEKGMNTLINLNVKDDKVYTALIKDMNGDPVTRALNHVDFWAVKAEQEVHVHVEIKLEGKAPGQLQGGIVEQVSHQVLLYCRADAIPNFISVDIGTLEIGHNIHLNEVKLPEGVRAKEGYNPTIVAVVEEKKIEEVVPVAAEGVEGAVPAEGAAPAEGAVAAPADGKAPAAADGKAAPGAAPAAKAGADKGAGKGGDSKKDKKK
ncbi:MAG TPA: 50S ribosomal protein L25 [bacterium]|nr:50S ribosomal protein L25 [bacterium]